LPAQAESWARKNSNQIPKNYIEKTCRKRVEDDPDPDSKQDRTWVETLVIFSWEKKKREKPRREKA